MFFFSFFLYIIDLAKLNVYYLFLVKTGNKAPFLDFSLAMLHQMATKFSSQEVPRPRICYTRLTEGHFPSFLDPTPSNPRPRRRCHVCTNNSFSCMQASIDFLHVRKAAAIISVSHPRGVATAFCPQVLGVCAGRGLYH